MAFNWASWAKEGFTKLLPKAIGRTDSLSQLVYRPMMAMGYMGAGFGASALIQHAASNRRAYYGNSRYDSYYGGAADQLSNAAKGIGLWYGFHALRGADPITRTKNSFSYWTTDRGLLRSPDQIRRGLIRSELRRSGTVSQAAKTNIRSAMSQAYGPMRATMVRNMPKIGILSAPAANGFVDQILARGPGVARAVTWAGMMGMAGGHVPIGIGTLGIAAAGGLLGVTAIAGGAGAMALGARGSHMLGFGMSAGITAAAGYGGYLVGSGTGRAASEGNIQSFDTGSVVSRMNFSTAGLVQALHNNNRKF